MATFVALFRGINVGGNQTVRMDELKALHEALGFKEVISYINSGNVVFRADDAGTAQLAGQIEEAFAQKFGFRVNVMVRTPSEMQEIIANNPFQNQLSKEPNRVVVLFLASRPERTGLEELRQAYSGPEEFYLNGQELYIYYPEGQGRSKLTVPLLEKKLKTSGTGRNLNTVLKLLELSHR